MSKETIRRDQYTQAQFESVKDGLKEHHRIVLAAAFGGDSQKTIAENLKLPVGTVKTRTMRGVRKMKKLLEANAGATLSAKEAAGIWP